MTDSTTSGPTVHNHNHTMGFDDTAAFTGLTAQQAQHLRLDTQRPGTNCCPQLVVCHTDLSIPSSVVFFMSLSVNHSVIFEIAPKHNISESLADYDG